MKEARIVLILILFGTLIHAVRGDADFSLPHVIPFMGGRRPGEYDLMGIAMILIFLWGMARLNRMRNRRRSVRNPRPRQYR